MKFHGFNYLLFRYEHFYGCVPVVPKELKFSLRRDIFNPRSVNSLVIELVFDKLFCVLPDNSLRSRIQIG